jgi:hypothetical protein
MEAGSLTRNEYDAYAIATAGLLLKGAGVDAIFDQVSEAVRTEMGLHDYPEEAIRDFADRLCAIAR